jgi:hypothetical protein
MKLRVRFLQLPILFDAARLAEEVAAIPESAWRPHPKNFPGNDALPLITTDGDPLSDARGGAMRATPHLQACPYLMQVLDALGATWGRSRLMRLSGAAEVTPHVDTDYYWRDHMRVHVPIVTQPTVRFLCGGETAHMAAGECWIFDTWSLHSVHNDANRARIHLVADTVGGAGFLALTEAARSPGTPRPGWSPRFVPPRPGPLPDLVYESCNLPRVMTPWELRDHLGFLLSEAAPGEPRVGPISQALNRLRVSWHALWAEAGPDEAARGRYGAILTEGWAQAVALGANEVPLRNGMPLGLCLKTLIFNSALGGAEEAMDADERLAPNGLAPNGLAPNGAAPAQPTGAARGARPPPRDPEFERPVFIVSSPRSGSSLLFETLSGAREAHTIGGESHGLIEAIPALTPAAHGWASNRLTAADARPETAQRLRERYAAALRDRDGRAPEARPARLLEKTPKNALRIPCLAAVFPEAQFLYLHRDPRPTLASMMEAWTSGAFRTYPELPGWRGPPWSLLLIPDWRSLAGAPLNEIVARQWATTTRILLDDLEALPQERWRRIDYEAFIKAPQTAAAGICAEFGLTWDRPVDAALPLARNTLSPPARDKWRARAAEIDAVAPLFEAESRRARALFG